MTATLADFASILKEFYLGPVQEQLNNEVLVLEIMQKMSVDWNGRLCHIPLHVGRSQNATGFIGEDVDLPNASEQDYRNYVVNARFLYGRFEVTGPAIASAGKGGKNSFIGWADAEMDKLVSDVKNAADQACFSGGRVLGFLNEKFDTGAANATRVWEFTGDIAKVNALRVATGVAPPGGLQVALCRLDLGNAAAYDWISASPADPVIISAEDPGNSTITLDDRTAGGVQLNTSVVGAGFAVAVVCVDVRGPVATGVNSIVGPLNAPSQPEGIYSNLVGQIVDAAGTVAAPGNVSQFGVPRNTGGANPAIELQSNILTQSTDPGAPSPAAAASTRQALSLPRMQQIMDQALTRCDEEPDLIVMHPTMRTQYTALLTVGLQTYTVRAENGDGGFTGLSYGNVPLKTARHAPRGGIIFLRQKDWKMLQLQPGDFADLDGSVLSRRADRDSWEGFYRWYYNTCCLRPNAQAMLVGINL